MLAAPHFKKHGKRPGLAAFVNGITAAAIGAIAGSLAVLAQRSLIDLPTVLLAIAAAALLWKLKRLPEPVIVAGAALLGVALFFAWGSGNRRLAQPRGTPMRFRMRQAGFPVPVASSGRGHHHPASFTASSANRFPWAKASAFSCSLIGRSLCGPARWLTPYGVPPVWVASSAASE